MTLNREGCVTAHVTTEAAGAGGMALWHEIAVVGRVGHGSQVNTCRASVREPYSPRSPERTGHSRPKRLAPLAGQPLQSMLSPQLSWS
jgi:hypothetical protein